MSEKWCEHITDGYYYRVHKVRREEVGPKALVDVEGESWPLIEWKFCPICGKQRSEEI